MLVHNKIDKKSQPFYCDDVMAQFYDELMTVLDPKADHIGWLRAVVRDKWPETVADIGAGTGRVLQHIRSSAQNVNVIAVEPSSAFQDRIIRTVGLSPGKLYGTIDELPARSIGLVYCTYGSLQYVNSQEEILRSLKELGSKVDPMFGLVALEFFAAEIYGDQKEISFPVVLGGESWNFSFSTEFRSEGLVLATTSLQRGSLIGEMREQFLPLSRDELYQLMLDAGFSLRSHVICGAYHRCVASVSG